MNNKKLWLYGGGALALLVLLSSFKKAPKRVGYIIPSNIPEGKKVVFSKVGTKIYDEDFNVIYEYEKPNFGMAVVGETKDSYDVVGGFDYLEGIKGFVLKSDVTEK
jgi:hypothetical protein